MCCSRQHVKRERADSLHRASAAGRSLVKGGQARPKRIRRALDHVSSGVRRARGAEGVHAANRRGGRRSQGRAWRSTRGSRCTLESAWRRSSGRSSSDWPADGVPRQNQVLRDDRRLARPAGHNPYTHVGEAFTRGGYEQDVQPTVPNRSVGCMRGPAGELVPNSDTLPYAVWPVAPFPCPWPRRPG